MIKRPTIYVVFAVAFTGGCSSNSESMPDAATNAKSDADKVMTELGLKDLAIEPKKVESPQAVESQAESAKQTKESSSSRLDSIELRRRWINANELPRESWEIQYLGNNPIGYSHELIKGSSVGAEGILRLEATSMVRFTKGNERLKQVLEVASVEQVDGRLRSIEINVMQGDSKTTSIGTVVLGRLKLRTESASGTVAREIPWKPEIGGPFSVMQTLRRKPMKPGETRELEMLDPILREVVRITLKAGDFINTPKLDGQQMSMLEIRSAATFENKRQESILWVNELGETQKSFASQVDIRSFRCEPTMATSVRDAAFFENQVLKTLPLPEVPNDIEQAKAILFKLAMKNGDPLRTVPQNEYQTVTKVDPFFVIYTISRPKTLDIDWSIEMQKQNPAPESEYTGPTPLLQSDDLMIKRIAEESLANSELGSKPLERLVRGVGLWIKEKTPYNSKMESAAQISRSHQGGANEHAMLLAASARSVGIPSRVVAGVRYQGSGETGRMEYHAWTELQVQNRWLAVDAMQPSGEVNSTYIHLTDSSMTGFNPYPILKSTLDILSKLEVSVESEIQ